MHWNRTLIRQTNLNVASTLQRQVTTIADFGIARAGTIILKTLNTGRVYIDGLGFSRLTRKGQPGLPRLD